MSHQEYSKLPRLYIEGPLNEGASLSLPADQAHYIKNVMRRKPGDDIRVFNGHDGEWRVQITDLGKKNVEADLIEQIKPQPENGPDVCLLFAPIKKARMDVMIEKAVELGATQLQPIITQNCEVRKINEGRVKAQIIEASEQSERLDVPALLPLIALDKLLGSWSKDYPILACLERQDAAPIGKALENGKGHAFLIGPEGGFTADEISLLEKQDKVVPVSLGPSILRSETASLFALAASKLSRE